MSSKPFIILGEAKESDSEEEIDFSATSTEYAGEHCKGKIISGEATESDEEYRDNKSTNETHESISFSVTGLTTKKTFNKHPSILVKKLYDRNVSLRNNFLELINQVSHNAEYELNNTNQRLLKCQVQMQQGVQFLKMINSNLCQLDSQLQSLLSINYLPLIKFS